MVLDAPLILYSREDCHLCDQVVMMLDQAGIKWRPVDIDQDAELARKYGVRIPVLRHPATENELFFPFGAEELRYFANQ